MPALSSSQQDRVQFAINLLDPYRNAIRYCSACGTCTSTCPVYKLTRNEKDTGRGHIRMVEWWITKLELETDWIQLINHALEVKKGLACCLRCYNCTTSCPSGLEIISTLEAARQSINILLPEHDILTLGFRIYGKWFRFINWLLFILSAICNPFRVDFNKSRIVAFQFLSGLSYIRNTELRNNSKRKSLRSLSKQSKGKVAYFHDCMSGLNHPYLTTKVKNVLNQIGYKVDVIPNSICCGAPFVAKGDYLALKSHAEHNARVLENLFDKYDFFVFSNPTCIKTVQKIYPQILKRECNFVSKLTLDWRLAVELLSNINPLPVKVAYHDACHLRNYSNEGDLIREICKVCGKYQQKNGEIDCCGFGGVFNFQFSELARELNRNRVNQIPTDTDIIVNANPACSLFLAVGLEERFSESQQSPAICHPMELLNLSLMNHSDFEDKKNH